jgi:hypothetical protein
MDERQPKPSGRPQEFTDLVSELGDLVETLGLEEAPPPPRARRSPPASRPSAPRAAAAAPAAAVAAPEVEAAPAPETPAGEAILDDTTFWVPPPAMVEPGARPWSPTVAMELLPGSREAAAAAVAVRPRSGWLMTAAAGTAVVLALFALVVSHIDLASTGGPDQAVSAPPFAVNQLRTVAAATTAAVATAPSTARFPAFTSHLFIEIQYGGATPHDSLQLRVIRDSDGLPPPTVVQDHTYRLDNPEGKGTVTVELAAPSGARFARGRYTVSVVHGQSAAQTVDFTVGDTGA